MKKNSGFTLIELAVVMAIIGLLAVLSIGSYRSSQVKARDAQRKNDLKQIANGLEVYFNDKGEYPAHSMTNEINGCASEATCDWGDEWEDENGTIYMVEMPSDPKDYLNYYYISAGNSYQIYARLENELDNEVPTVDENPSNYGISCGSSNCNYGLSSTNVTVTEGRTIIED